VSVDWSYINQELGFRKEQEGLEKAIGKFLLIVSIFVIVFLTMHDMMFGKLFWHHILQIDSAEKLVVYLALFVMVYAFFLLRDRDHFLDRIKTKDFTKLTKSIKNKTNISNIELIEYFDHNVLNTLDDILNQSGENFLADLMIELRRYAFVRDAIRRLGLTDFQFKEIINKIGKYHNIHVAEWIRPLLIESFVIAFRGGFEYIGEMSIFLWLCKRPLAKILLKYNVSVGEVDALEMWVSNKIKKKKYKKLFKRQSLLKPINTVNRAFTSRYSPTLEKYSRDFTAEVVRGDFTMSIARDTELQKTMNLIQQGSASATMLIGSHGVGKTTLLKSMAVQMVVEDVPEILKDMRLVSFDFNRAYALSSNVAEFKSIVEKVLEETAEAKNIILVLDDIDDLVEIKQEIAAEVVNLVTKAMDNYKIRLIATSSIAGYTQHISKYKSLVTLFNTVRINEPSDNVAVQILMDEVPILEKKFNIEVSFDTLVKIVELSHNFSFDRVLPDKGIILLEESMVAAQNQNLHFVSEQLIEQIVSSKVGVQVGAISGSESKKLLNMEEELHKRVIGQEPAVIAVASALRRSRAGLTDNKRPIASFLFFGPTGVGKTELAKAMTETYYGKETEMIRVDMSEYQEEANLKRLIGDVNDAEFEGGYLTNTVRQNPYSLILLDEIEKANPKVLDLFLQILDEGHVTDGMGRDINFTNTIIIATSNVASKEIADELADDKTYEQVKEQVMPKIRQFLRIEFLNRFDKIIMFKPLSFQEIVEIGKLLLNLEKKKLVKQNIRLEFGDELINEIAKLGYNPLYGARELRRVIQDNVQDKLAELIISGKVSNGEGVYIKNLDDFEIKN